MSCKEHASLSCCFACFLLSAAAFLLRCESSTQSDIGFTCAACLCISPLLGKSLSHI